MMLAQTQFQDLHIRMDESLGHAGAKFKRDLPHCSASAGTTV